MTRKQNYIDKVFSLHNKIIIYFIYETSSLRLFIPNHLYLFEYKKRHPISIGCLNLTKVILITEN